MAELNQNEKPARRMTVMSDILRTTPENDNLGLLFAISEGFDSIKRIKDEWQAEDDALGGARRFCFDDIGNSRDSNRGPFVFDAGPNYESRRSDQITNDGMRAHRTALRNAVYSDENDESEEEVEENQVQEGSFSTQGSSTWNIGVLIRSLGSTKEKRIVAVIAWLICVISMLVGLVIIAMQYSESRNSKSRAIHYTIASELSLPTVMACNTYSSFPPFLDLPNKKYHGLPTSWIDKVLLPGHKGKVIQYPQTHEMKQISLITIDRRGRKCKPLGLADPVTFNIEARHPPRCFYCWTFSRSPPIIVKRKYGTVQQRTKYVNSLMIRFSRSRLLEKCRMIFSTPSPDEKRVFLSILRPHLEELEKRGILDFGGLNASDPKNVQLFFPANRKPTNDYFVRDVFDMYCNVILFSGYFYPATNVDVRYKFHVAGDLGIGTWQRAGRGPYYPPDLAKFFFGLQQRVHRNASVGGEEKDLFFRRGDYMETYTNTTEFNQLVQLNQQAHATISEIMLDKALVQGKEVYTPRAFSTQLHSDDISGVDFFYVMKIGFDKFVVRSERDQVTTSTTSFLADFFGLISLFLDVSVYTVFVAPIVMRFKRRSIRQEIEQS